MPNDAFYYLFPQKIVDFCSFSFRLKIIFSFSLQEKLQGARHVEHFTKTKVGATGGACRGVSSTRLSLSLSAHFYSCTHSGRLLESLDTNKCTFQPATEADRNLSFFGAKNNISCYLTTHHVFSLNGKIQNQRKSIYTYKFCYNSDMKWISSRFFSPLRIDSVQYIFCKTGELLLLIHTTSPLQKCFLQLCCHQLPPSLSHYRVTCILVLEKSQNTFDRIYVSLLFF